MASNEVYLNEKGDIVKRQRKPGRPSNAQIKQRDALIKTLKRSRELQLRKQYEPAILTRTKEMLVFTRSIGVSDSNIARISGVRVEKIRMIRDGTYKGVRGTGSCERVIGAIQSLFAAILMQARELALLDERALRPAQIRVELEKAIVTYEMSGIPPNSLRPVFVGHVHMKVSDLIDAKTAELIRTAEKKGFDEIQVQVFINKESFSGLPPVIGKEEGRK